MASSKHPKSPADSASDAVERVIPPTQQVWLAGLGAMAKAQEQGSKAIEALLSDGLAYQRKSQAQAQQRLQEATERLSHMASDLGQNASVRVDKLEHLFEDRVAKALHRLGMPSLVDIQMLSERVLQLEAQLQALGQPKQTPAADAAVARKKPRVVPGSAVQKVSVPKVSAAKKVALPTVASRKKSA